MKFHQRGVGLLPSGLPRLVLPQDTQVPPGAAHSQTRVQGDGGLQHVQQVWSSEVWLDMGCFGMVCHGMWHEMHRCIPNLYSGVTELVCGSSPIACVPVEYKAKHSGK